MTTWGNRLLGFGFIAVLGQYSSIASADYSSSCSMYATNLEQAASSYENKKRQYEREKSSFESACGPYGYSRQDEYACSDYGYIRSSFRDAVEAFERSGRQLKTAISDVGAYCGVPQADNQLLKFSRQMFEENKRLKQRLAEVEAELKGAGSTANKEP